MKTTHDYYGDHFSYISQARAKRPQEFGSHEEVAVHPDPCMFCPGHEEQTPPEIGRIDDGQGGWKIRWFPNKFPAVAKDQEAYGSHEVIVESAKRDMQLWDLSPEDMAQLFGVYQGRIAASKEDPRLTSAVVFKNHGKEGGASLVHSHTQLIASALPFSRLERRRAYQERSGQCPSCMLLQDHKEAEAIAQDDNFLVICPRAPRFAMEAWIVAKDHQAEFLTLDDARRLSLATHLAQLLRSLRSLQAPYCFYIPYLLRDSQPHFQLELLPRLHKWAGFELATGDYIIGITPEDAAEFYREPAAP